MILRTFPFYRVRSFGPLAIGEVERRGRAGGNGDLLFERPQGSRSGQINRPGFFGIADVGRAKAAVASLRSAVG